MPPPPLHATRDGDEEAEEAGLHFGVLGYSVASILALAAIWITVFSASPGILPQPNPVYDFIVVGSGTAGSVLAARLANGTEFRVLVLEAGEEEPWVSKLPLSTLMLQGSKHDWKYYTEPQEYSSYGMLGKKSYWPRGKMLGGTAQLNYNIFTLGWREHYDRWATQHQLEGWASEDLMRHVKELFCFPEQVSGTEDHPFQKVIPSAGGWSAGEECRGDTMPLSTLSSNMSHAFVSSAQELQSSTNTSSIHLGQLVSVHQGQRWSTLTSFLRPAMQSRSLHVVIQAHVTKILFEGRRAVGVEWHQWGAEKNVRQTFVKGEVIVAAGAVNSPVLLMQSGVGRRAELEELEIPMVAPSAGVGRNLVDQMNLPVYVHINSSISINSAKLVTFQNFWKYFTSGGGLFADTGLGGILTEYPKVRNFSETGNTPEFDETTEPHCDSHDHDLNGELSENESDECPANSSASTAVNENDQQADLEVGVESEKSPVGLLLFNMADVDRESYARAANLAPEVFDHAYPDMQNSSREGMFLLASCLQPRSRGHVKVAFEPRRHLSIQPSYLEDYRDVQCMKRAFRLLERFVGTPTMQSIGATLHYPQLPRCGATTRNTMHHHSTDDDGARETSIDDHGYIRASAGLEDEEVECIIRTLAFTGYHPVGTLKMGPQDDEEAVVDLQMRLRGVEGVRVADASVLPSHPAAAPAAVTALYGARAADFVKEAWLPVSKVRRVEPCYKGVCGEDLYYSSAACCQTSSWCFVVLSYLLSRVACSASKPILE